MSRVPRALNTGVAPEQRAWTKLLPPYRVILYNDDVHSMDHVVHALLTSVPGLSSQAAAAIMFEAHNTGSAVVTVCPLEQAELYRDRLQSHGLTATIEPDT